MVWENSQLWSWYILESSTPATPLGGTHCEVTENSHPRHESVLCFLRSSESVSRLFLQEWPLGVPALTCLAGFSWLSIYYTLHKSHLMPRILSAFHKSLIYVLSKLCSLKIILKVLFKLKPWYWIRTPVLRVWWHIKARFISYVCNFLEVSNWSFRDYCSYIFLLKISVWLNILEAI